MPPTDNGSASSVRLPIRAAMAASGALHVVAAVIVLVVAARAPAAPVVRRPAAQAPVPISQIVFLAAKESLGGGGGGGGNRQSAPITHAESRGEDTITLRVAKPPVTASRESNAEPPLPALLLDARPLASGAVEQLGLPQGGVSYGLSAGPGSGGGVGTGPGTGTGPGIGPGFGPGTDGGIGGSVYRPSGAVTAPQLVVQVRPTYTAKALDLRIQGAVELELIVTAEGRPSAVRVVRSLDRGGLDEQAVDAVRQWVFKPGRLAAVPVSVLVTVVLQFTIH